MCFIAGNIAILKSMALQETFINNLKFYRKKAGLTQAQLALLIDKSFNYINGIECGVSFPPPDVIEKIAERLGVTPVQLFSESGCPINIVSFNKEKIVDEITQNLYARLRDEIHKEIEKILER